MEQALCIYFSMPGYYKIFVIYLSIFSELSQRFQELEALKKSMASYVKYQQLRCKKPDSLPKIQGSTLLN